MQEVAIPAAIELPITDTLADIAMDNAVRRPDFVIYTRRTDDGWADITCADFWSQVREVAKGLVASGIEPGGIVAVMSETRYEWTVLDFALWTIGACAVPIYETSSAEQIRWITGDSGAAAIVTSSRKLRDIAAPAVEGLPAAERIWVIEDGLIEHLAAVGVDVSDGEIDARRRGTRPGDLATIIYTSGTTGRPKGCELTHANLLYEVRTIIASTGPLMAEDGANTLLFLPLAHIFARATEVWCAVGGLRLTHTSSIRTLSADMAVVRPTFLIAVPRVFEKLYNTASQGAHASGRGPVFDRAADVAIQYSRAKQAGSVNLVLRAQHAVFDKLVYSRFRAALGGRAHYAVSGGASLGERLGHFFAGVGLLVMEGYGLTETTGPATFNRPENPRIGTVGQPMAGSTVRIADDGEIWLRGPNTMRGYHNNPEATAEVLDADGWFHTGDVGQLDEQGFLRITGRKKEIIVTAAGKNVAPAVLEDRVQAHILVNHCLVVGEGRPFIGALITLDPDGVRAWAEPRGKASLPLAELHQDPELLAQVQSAVDEANKAVSRAESIRKWRIVERDWSERSGHVTSSLKLRRSVILTDFADEVEALYTK